jgi:LDH2 family malate/lactate/ureidoglycolate dehydrogenase
MHVSVREVVQLSDRCFSAAGFAAGPADAYASAIWWTELYRKTGLETLHALLPELSALDRGAVTLQASGSRGGVVDTADQPALLATPPATDLACARADRDGVGVVRVVGRRGDRTLPTLGRVACHAAERGCVAVVVHGDDEAGGAVIAAPDDPHPVVGDVPLGAPPRSYLEVAAVLDDGLHERRHAPLTQALFAEPAPNVRQSTADRRLLARLLERSMTSDGTGGSDVDSGFVVVCLDPTHSRWGGTAHVVDRFLDDRVASDADVYRPDRIQDRATRLLEEGVSIDRAVWRDVFEYSSGILAPPFEGSHRGAGFDITD